MMRHGVLSVEKSACEDIIAWLWGKYSSERRERIPLQWVKFNFEKITFRLGFRSSLKVNRKNRIKLRFLPFLPISIARLVMSFDYTCVNVNIYHRTDSCESRRFFICLLHERFHEKIVVFLFATIFGLTSAIFLSAGGENELVKPQDPSYPYSLIDVRAQSLPIQNFTAIIPVERGLCVNVSRFPSSPITEEASGNAAFCMSSNYVVS